MENTINIATINVPVAGRPTTGTRLEGLTLLCE